MGRPLRLVSADCYNSLARKAGSCQCHTSDRDGTYVLSFACFKLSRNFMPAAVVEATVSDFALVSTCTQAILCQQSSRGLFLGIPPLSVCTGGARVVLRERGGAGSG